MDSKILFIYKFFILIEIFLSILIILRIRYYKILQKIFRSLLFFIIVLVTPPLEKPSSLFFKIIIDLIAMILLVIRIEKNNFLFLKKVKAYGGYIWIGIKKKMF